MGCLSPGSRQAGGGDRDDLGQPSPDPGRRLAQKLLYLSHLIFHRRPRERGAPWKMASAA